MKAWNAKIVPIFLTMLSTVIGFIPFMVGSLKEAFWFPLAAGTSGGLLVSFLALFFLLPVFIGSEYKVTRVRSKYSAIYPKTTSSPTDSVGK